MRTIFNILKTYIGVGVLGLPHAWMKGGVLGALGSMAVLLVISLHCLNLLVESKEQLLARGDRVYTFGDVTVKAFGKWGKFGGTAVDVILVGCQLGVCTSYLVFLGQNTQAIMPGGLPWEIYGGIWILIMMLLSWIRTLKSLAPLATIATACLGLGLFAIAIASSLSLHDTVSAKLPVKVNLFDWRQLPATLSVAIFAFEGIGFVIPAQTAIKDPKRYPFVLTFCVITVGILYCIFGTLVYVGFGDNTKDQIIDSLLAWANGDKTWTIISKLISAGLIVAIAFTYPIQFFVSTDILEERLFPPKDHSWTVFWVRNNFRAMLVFITGILALTVNQFNVIVGLIGALGASPLQFIFPPLIWLFINWHDARYWKRALLIFYICFGAMATILGTGVNIMDLIKNYQK